MKNLFLGVCLAPYRIDLYNYLYMHFSCDIYFQNRNLVSQKFDISDLRKNAIFPERYLETIKVGGRKIIHNMKRMILEFQPEIVFTPEFSLITIQVLVLRKILHADFKVVSICDDSMDMICGNDFSYLHKIARKIIVPLLDNLIVANEDTLHWYQNNYSKGVWFPIVSDEMKMRARYEQLLSLSQRIYEKENLVNKKVILFVGRLVALKNIKILINAFLKIKEDATLIIIGDGEEREYLQSISAESKSIIFKGRLEGEELYAWYNIADICVLPSTQEAFGAVINEALLAGCICLVSEKAGSKCLIDENNGDIFDPYNMEVLSRLLDTNLKKIVKSDKLVLKPNLMPISFETMLSSTLSEL